MFSSPETIRTAAGQLRRMGRQQWVYRRERHQLPVDFPRRIERLKEATGLSWRGFARQLRTDPSLVRRWRKGTRPDSGNLYSLLRMAAEIGQLHLFFPENGLGNCEDG